MSQSLRMTWNSIKRIARRKLPQRSGERCGRRLFCEGLDQRTLLSTFDVTTTADGGAGSLRQAIIDANASPGADTINLSQGDYDYILDIAGSDEDAGATGDLDVTDDLTITGPGDIIASNLDRVFHVHGARVTLSGIGVTGGGSDQGGGIFNAGGDLTLSNSSVFSNSAAEGAGIFNAGGVVTLRESSITFNMAPEGTGILTAGAGIFNAGGEVTLLDTYVTFNHANAGGGIYSTAGNVLLLHTLVDGNVGSAIYSIGANVVVTQSTISENGLSGSASSLREIGGGGIFAQDSTVSIVDSSLVRNAARRFFLDPNGSALGGAIYGLRGTIAVTNSDVSENQVTTTFKTGDAAGGGIYVKDANVTLINVTMRSNNAAVDRSGNAAGGAVFASGGTVAVINALLEENSASAFEVRNGRARGGGIYTTGSQFSLTNTTLIGNIASGFSRDSAARGAGVGGAIYVGSGEFTATNCLLSGNWAIGGSSLGTYGDGLGGGMYVEGGIVTLVNCDVIGNNAISNDVGIGGGIYIAAGSVTITRSTDTEDNFASTSSDDIFQL